MQSSPRVLLWSLLDRILVLKVVGLFFKHHATSLCNTYTTSSRRRRRRPRRMDLLMQSPST